MDKVEENSHFPYSRDFLFFLQFQDTFCIMGPQMTSDGNPRQEKGTECGKCQEIGETTKSFEYSRGESFNMKREQEQETNKINPKKH